MESAFSLIIGRVAQQVLTMHLLSDPLHRLFQAFLTDEAVLGAAGEARKDVQRIFDKQTLHAPENVDKDRYDTSEVVILIDGGRRERAAGRYVLSGGRNSRRTRHHRLASDLRHQGGDVYGENSHVGEFGLFQRLTNPSFTTLVVFLGYEQQHTLPVRRAFPKHTYRGHLRVDDRMIAA